MNSLLKIVKESGINFSGSLLGMLLNYILLMIITRFLSPDKFGIFTLAQSIINVSLIFVLFGTPKALDRFIPYYNVIGEQGKIKTLIYRIVKITFILGFLIGLIIFITSGFISQFFFGKPQLSSVLKIMVLSVPMLAFIQVISFAFIGFKELRYRVYIQQILLPFSKIVLALVIFTLGYGLLGWTWMYIFSLLSASLLGFWFFRRYLLLHFSKVDKIPICIREIISYSWPLSINSIIIIILGQINFLFLGYFSPSKEIGIYRIYLYLVVFLSLIMSSFAQIYKPVISSLIARNASSEINDIYKRISKWIFHINALAFLIILLFGSNIVGILFTKAYLTAPFALYILSAGYFLNSAFGPEGMTLEAFGNTKLSMLNAIIMLMVNLGLNYLLIPTNGIIGAAIATASSLTIGGFAGLIEIHMLHSLQPFNFKYFKYTAVSLTIGSIFYIVKLKIILLNPLNLIALIILLCILYTAGLYYSRSLDDIDYQTLQRIRTRIINRNANAK